MRNTDGPSMSLKETEQQTRYLYWWLILALIFEYARPGSWVPVLEAIKLNSLIPLGLLAFTMFAKGLRPAKDIFADPLAKWMVIYVLLVLLSITHAAVTFYTVERITQVLGYFFLFWIIARTVTSPERVRGIFLTLMAAHLFLLAMNPLVVLDPSSRHYIQGATFVGDGNDFALSMCILVPLGIDAAFSTQSKLMRTVVFLMVGVLLLAAIGTASRGATLGLVSVAAYLWWRSPRKMLTLFVISIVAAGVLFYASDLYFERMATITNYEEEGSAQGRIIAWGAAINMALDNPILGVGAGQFPTEFGTEYRPADYGGRFMTAHSMYFLILGELGLPGIVTLMTLVFGNIIANGRARRACESQPDDAMRRSSSRMLLLLSGGVIGFAVAGAFLSVAYYPHVFVLSGLGIAARRICIEQRQPTNESTATKSARSTGPYRVGRPKPAPGISVRPSKVGAHLPKARTSSPGR